MQALQVSGMLANLRYILMRCKFSEFDPSFTAVAKAWTTVSEPERSDHFWATLDFDEAQQVFQKVCSCSST